MPVLHCPPALRPVGASPDSDMTDDHFLTTEEVLDYLQVNLRTIYRLIKAGKIPAVRVGRQWRSASGTSTPGWPATTGDTGRAPPSTRRASSSSTTSRPSRNCIAKTLALADYDVDTAARRRRRRSNCSRASRLRPAHHRPEDARHGRPVGDPRGAPRKSTDLPIVIITGYSTEASAIEAINLGVSGYLTKPFRLPRVLAVAARSASPAARRSRAQSDTWNGRAAASSRPSR